MATNQARVTVEVLPAAYFTPQELAAVLKVHHKTILRWLRDSDHPLRGEKIGEMWRISREQIEAFLNAGREANK